MNCRSFNRNLDDYLEGGLDFPGRFGMERHADQCYVCRRSLVDAEKLRQAVRRLGKVVAPPDFEAAVLARIHARPEPGWSGFRDLWLSRLDGFSRRLAFAAAALAFVVLGIAAGRLIWSKGQVAARPADVASVKESPAVPAVEPSRPAVTPVPVASDPEPALQRSKPAYPAAAWDGYRLPRNAGLEASDPDYFEFLLPGPDDRELIMRLPRTIRMRYRPPSEEYFIRNVSH